MNIYSYYDTISDPCAVCGTGISAFIGGFHRMEKQMMTGKLCKGEQSTDESAILHLKYLGRDSWDRPVYMDDEGVIWKDVNPRAGGKANLCTSVSNEFDGEPDTGMEYFKKYQGISVVFIPARDVW